MKNRKRVRRIALIAVMLSILGIFGTNQIQARADTKKISKTKQTYLFAVPEGGWSSCSVDVVYTEYYHETGATNIFNKRTRWYTASCAYATEKPVFIIGNVVHRNSSNSIVKSFKSWQPTDGIFGGGYDYFGTEKKLDSVTYSRSTTYKGELAYIVKCSGAMVPIHTGKVSMKLSTT